MSTCTPTPTCMGLSAVDADNPDDALDADIGLDDVDLDEAWMALHLTLTGGIDTDGDALYDVVLGGLPCAGGQGPLFLAPGEVRTVSARLHEVRECDLRALHEEHCPDVEYEEVADYFVEVAGFYERAAVAGWGVIKYLY